jgi:Zn-dependent protease/CBS domain-containing protein
MRWSWTLGRVAGIELRVHATFLLLLAWLGLVAYRTTGTVGGAARGVLMTLALFASVVLHEYGHALTGRRFGVPTRDITLLPFGGVARLEHMPEEPRHELAIALAGPAVTLVIALVLYIVIRIGSFPLVADMETIGASSVGGFLARLMWLNVILLVFNLIPAFPMDGGRVLRAALALRLDHRRATAIATRLGRGFALLFGIIGIFYNPLLVVIGLFICVCGAAESSALQERTALGGVPVERLMIRDARALAPDDTLAVALRHVLDGFQEDFPVVAEARVVGVLTRAALLAGLARAGPDSAVAAAMDASFATARADEPVTDALARLRTRHCRTLPVLRDDRLVGVLTADNVAEYVMIEEALRASETSENGRRGEGRNAGATV